MPSKHHKLILEQYRDLGRWQAFSRVPRSFLPHCWRAWVLDRGSLTKRMIKASSGDFRVQVAFQGWLRPTREEALTLGLKVGQIALVREVELCCYGQVWVRARSIIPEATLSGEERQLKHLGDKPLGAFLFTSRTMKRRALELASFRDESGEVFYARRSVFMLHNKPLLVSEYFLPELLKHPSAR